MLVPIDGTQPVHIHLVWSFGHKECRRCHKRGSDDQHEKYWNDGRHVSSRRQGPWEGFRPRRRSGNARDGLVLKSHSSTSIPILLIPTNQPGSELCSRLVRVLSSTLLGTGLWLLVKRVSVFLAPGTLRKSGSKNARYT